MLRFRCCTPRDGVLLRRRAAGLARVLPEACFPRFPAFARVPPGAAFSPARLREVRRLVVPRLALCWAGEQVFPRLRDTGTAAVCAASWWWYSFRTCGDHMRPPRFRLTLGDSGVRTLAMS